MPFERKHGRKWKWFSFAFNGNIANFAELKKPLLEKSGYHFVLNVDTEIVMHYIARAQMGNKKKSMADLFRFLGNQLDGAYSLAFMDADGEMAIVRDPWGFRPLVYGYIDKDTLVAASETNALANVGVKRMNYLKPGQMIHVGVHGNVHVKQYIEPRKKSACMFEWVYFANVSSILDGRSVYITRRNLGRELAKREREPVNERDYIVIPVPDTAKACGDAMAYELGIPSKEGLIRNRYVGRTFIEGDKGRHLKVQTKYSLVKEIIKGKKIILVDDSVVRGSTLKELVTYLKKIGGAKEVHIRVSCPPIMGPCFYGIDMSTITQLWAPHFIKQQKPDGSYDRRILKEMAETIGADSLDYNTINSVARSIGIPRSDLCFACLDRKYPTPTGRKLFKISLENHKNGNDKKRTYE